MGRLFGTDGIRGEAGRYPLDEVTIRRLGGALSRRLGGGGRIVIGRDTRESGGWIERALIGGITRSGAEAIVTGVIPTPGVAFLAGELGAQAGVVISASHNPYQDNGIKIFAPNGQKLSEEMEKLIEDEILDAPPSEETSASTSEALHTDPGLANRYSEYLLTKVAAGLDLRGRRIAIDCANGAASAIAPTLFRSLGAIVEVVNASPDGRNINLDCGALHPGELQRRVVDSGAELGLAFDGDADRLIAVDETGAILDGDHILFVMSDYLHRHDRLTPRLVVATVMSNLGLELALRDRGIEMTRTSVGDKYVLDELLRSGGLLGGEQSGHIIFPEISLAGDGMITAIELLRASGDAEIPLSRQAAGMARLPQLLTNLRVSRKIPLDRLPEVESSLRRMEDELAGRGRILVRYSGTENIARIMIEAEDEVIVRRQSDELRQLLDHYLNQVAGPVA